MYEELGFSAMAVFSMIYAIVFAVSIAFWLLQSIGIYKMGKNMGFTSPWLAFIPFANHYTFGKIAEKYIKNDGRPSAKFSKILLWFSVGVVAAVFVFMIFAIVSIVVQFINIPDLDALTYNEDMAVMVGLKIFLILLIGYFVLWGVAVAFNVVYYVALWRVFAIYDNKNATLYLVLSIFFPFLYPIFLFILRNRQPKFTFEQRMNIM